MRQIPVLFVLLSCLVAPAAATADVLPVAPGGSVQDAVDAAAPGDTVQLTGAGAYAGPVLITKSLTLTGPAGAVLSAPSGESNVLEVQNSDAGLQGFTVDATGVGIGVLVRNALMESHAVSVRDLAISGYDDAGLVARFAGLALDAEGIVVEGNGAAAPGLQRGIVVERGAVATIRDATVTANCGATCAAGPEDPLAASPAGVLVRDAASAAVIGSALSGNRVGVRAAGAARVDVLDARLRENGTGVQVLDVEGGGTPAATDGVVHGSEITGGARGVLVRDATPGDGLRPAPRLRADRIVGQSGIGVDADVPVQATDVWWGCNAGAEVQGAPDMPGCSSVTPGVDADPHLVLRLAAGPGTIATGGGTASLTADLTRNSAGTATGAAFPDGTPVAFASDRGSVSPGTAPTSAATAGATLTSGSEAGTATTSAALDGQTVTTPVTIAEPAPPTTVTETTTTTTPPTTVTQTVTETTPPTAPVPPPTVAPTPTPTPTPGPTPPAPPTGAEMLAAARKAIGRRVVRLTPSLAPGVAYVDRAVRSGRGTLTIADEDVVSLLVLACPERACDAGVSAKVERTSKAGRKLAPYGLRRATFSLEVGRQRVVAVRLTRAQRQGIRRVRTATMVVVAAVSGPGGERSKRTLRLKLRIRR